ncbi:type II toxin-antitoxin system HicA family toxin [Cohaesibacter sp. CAU 1516]|uniref:type II toxin-antitoxin system HicA family toxin n=1 Tax=Cohaesibacter sp. CAU 1516 TaxID=2576038 RepID=UPI0010FD1E50|nr:type II toxin-antitoxin system HicA family toxin [Cohaesibacter sp. CAU 1516]TLP48638.1 type II toxin-antitoxin system HicA family toxin [Cohaesibacter sp. CAU 1516]
MGKTEKLLRKLTECNGNFDFKELCTLLQRLGYELKEKGRSSGSRIAFYNEERDHMILTHRPHPEKEIKGGALADIKEKLTEVGFL